MLGILSVLAIGSTLGLANAAEADQFPKATSFAEDFLKVCVEPGPDDAAVALKAAERGLEVSVVGRKTDRTLPVSASGYADDSTVMLNAYEGGSWTCLMSRTDPKGEIPTFALRKAIKQWTDGSPTSWNLQRGSSRPKLWFAYDEARNEYLKEETFLRTNRLGDSVVLYYHRAE